MSVTATPRPELPPLPLAEWAATRTTLHLWVQIVGKMRLASTPPRNHWWHAPLYVGVRGLTTRRLRGPGGRAFQIDFDLVDHRLVVSTNGGVVESFALADGLSVAEFDERLHGLLRGLELDVEIREQPFGLATKTAFPDDREHAAYDRDAVERLWRVLEWSDLVFEEFAGWYSGKTSPVHLFWHSFDLAVSRFGIDPAPTSPTTDGVTREAYSHEVVSFGFWPGDETIPEPSYYSYTAPEPGGLTDRPLGPAEAWWHDTGRGSLALLRYDDVRAAADPKATLLGFLESAYDAGAEGLGWDRARFESSWAPRVDGDRPDGVDAEEVGPGEGPAAMPSE